MFKKKKSPRDEAEVTRDHVHVVQNPLYGRSLPFAISGSLSPRSRSCSRSFLDSVTSLENTWVCEKNPAPFVDPEVQQQAHQQQQQEQPEQAHRYQHNRQRV